MEAWLISNLTLSDVFSKCPTYFSRLLWTSFLQIFFRQKTLFHFFVVVVHYTFKMFRPAKLILEQYVETTWIFRPSKLRWKKYVETTWIFRSAKLRQKKYRETTWIFWSAKLHRKSTWKFGLHCIDILSTSNRCGFDVVCPLGKLWRQILVLWKSRIINVASGITHYMTNQHLLQCTKFILKSAINEKETWKVQCGCTQYKV